MSDEFDFATGLPAGEMAQYLQMYLDETAEQLDALVESLLQLEVDPRDVEQLNESFRMIHSIKGSSAMMGLDTVTILTHQLENHFERLRSGLKELDQPSMGLILRCIDFLRSCNERLRAGQPLGSAPELLEELSALNSGPASPSATAEPVEVHEVDVAVETVESGAVAPPPAARATAAQPMRLIVRFEQNLALTDLKAELVLARVSALAEVLQTDPPRESLSDAGNLRLFQVLLRTAGASDEIRAAADVDGVELIEIFVGETSFEPPEAVAPAPSVIPAPAIVPAMAAAEVAQSIESPDAAALPAGAAVAEVAGDKS